jgi:hypothetical protein
LTGADLWRWFIAVGRKPSRGGGHSGGDVSIIFCWFDHLRCGPGIRRPTFPRQWLALRNLERFLRGPKGLTIVSSARFINARVEQQAYQPLEVQLRVVEAMCFRQREIIKLEFELVEACEHLVRKGAQCRQDPQGLRKGSRNA